MHYCSMFGTLSIRNRAVTTCYFYAFKADSFGAGMHHKAARQQRPMAATTIPKNYSHFSIDFNFIYIILNIIKVNKEGELIWR